ncbi:hypothetical protein PI124_g23803 [Phytophthora idaei]|nr:hypothetical protein PI124_g23803 [Phytophthora idaei]
MRLKRGAGTTSSGTCGIIGAKSVYPQLDAILANGH